MPVSRVAIGVDTSINVMYKSVKAYKRVANVYKRIQEFINVL